MVIFKQGKSRKKCGREKFQVAGWQTGQQQELPLNDGFDKYDLRSYFRTEPLTALSDLSSGTIGKFSFSGEMSKKGKEKKEKQTKQKNKKRGRNGTRRKKNNKGRESR